MVVLVLNLDKCVLRQAELSYLGEVITNDGVKHDPGNQIYADTDEFDRVTMRVRPRYVPRPLHTEYVRENRSPKTISRERH